MNDKPLSVWLSENLGYMGVSHPSDIFDIVDQVRLLESKLQDVTNQRDKLVKAMLGEK